MRLLVTIQAISSVTRMQVRNVPIWWLDTKVRATLKPPLSPNGDAGATWTGGRILSDQPKRNSVTVRVKIMTKPRGQADILRLQSPSSAPAAAPISSPPSRATNTGAPQTLDIWKYIVAPNTAIPGIPRFTTRLIRNEATMPRAIMAYTVPKKTPRMTADSKTAAVTATTT